MDTDMAALDLPDADVGAAILSELSSSVSDEHRRLCSFVGAMAQELKDQSIPLSPVAYLGATLSALDRLSNDPCAAGTLLCFLSFVMPRVSRGILVKRRLVVLRLLVRVLRGKGLTADARIAGVKCVAGLLVARDDSVGWEDTAEFYEFLLGFVTDSDAPVRREAHQCVRDVLQSFQGSPLIGLASEAFTNLFQKLILLTGASHGAPAEKGAQEILHVLEALKDCLPYISKKYKTAILKYYKTLLELRKPLVTRRVTDSLNILCLHPTVDISAELLVDLLGSLAGSVGMEETSADGLTFIARLLDVGMRKVYTVNRQICTDKLPPVLSALQDILGAGFEEAKFAATEGIKNLIQTCIDEELIKQGVDRIKAGKSSASVIERICATIGSLLHNRYRSEWDMAFQVLSELFEKLGRDSSVLLRKTLVDMATIANESDEDFAERKQLQECMGCALQAIGPQDLLSIIPLNLRADNLSEVNDWLFPILKQYTVGSSLRFYVESLWGEVGYLKDKSHRLKVEGRVQSSRAVDSLAYHVWSLLPSFCNYPIDTAQNFNVLVEILCGVITEEPDLHGIICSSLQILIQQNKCIVEGISDDVGEKLSVSYERAKAYYNHEVASDNLKALRSYANRFLTVLSKAFLESKNDPGGSLQMTIREFTSIAEKDVVSRIFRRKMKQLLELMKGTKDVADLERDSDRAKLLDLAVSLLPGLGSEETNVLFGAIKPALTDANGLVQKKAYKVLSIILKDSNGFISGKLEELLNLMSDLLLSCHFSAKRHRLDCLFHLIVHLNQGKAEQLQGKVEQKKGEFIHSFLTEILLALKEANKKTRNRAYDVLVQIGHACGDEERGGNKENLSHFFYMVAGGLAGESPHMISAAVKGLARLAYEFSDLVSSAYNILPSTFLLLKRKNREIIKANLGLLKVLVAKSPADYLQGYLRVMVEGLLNWQDDTKNHFKAKVKHLLEMLVKKCGLDAVKFVMPEDHMKLLTNIRKIKERRERKLAANSETRSYRSRATTSRHSEWGHTKIFSDFDEETSDKDYMDAETATSRRSKLSLKLKSRASSLRSKKSRSGKSSSKALLHQLEDEPLDLLDQRKTRLAFHSGGKRKFGSDDEPEFDEEGRLIIHDGGKSMINVKGKSLDHESDEEDRTEVASYVSRNSAKKAQKRQKTSNSGWAYTGSEYASKKARGDVKKKGKLEPYAYWPLDRKLLSRRPEHKAAARRGMASVAKLTKKLEGRSVASALSIKTKKMKKKKSAKST